VSKKLTGKGTRIAIIGTGVPTHRDLSNISDFQTFADKIKTPDDDHGNSTIISGVIAANGKHGLSGLAPNTELLFAKALSDSGAGTSNSVVASILWCLVKDVDVIVMPFGTQEDCSVLHEAIKKAFAANIALVAPAGREQKDDEINFPARYPEVLAVGANYKDDKFGIKPKTINETVVNFPKAEIPTLYGDQSIAYVSGFHVATGVVGALASLLIERDKASKKLWTIKDTYSNILSLDCG
jgi:subtilisin family serine protease